MPIPATALAFEQPVDPSDVQDFAIILSQGPADAKPTPFLLPGETVASFAMSVGAEAAAAGLQIRSDAGYAPTYVANKITFWPVIAAGQQGSALFDGDGVRLAIELTVVTSNSPARTKQRSIVVRVAHLFATAA